MCYYCGVPNKTHTKAEYKRIRSHAKGKDSVWKSGRKAEYYGKKFQKIQNGEMKGDLMGTAYMHRDAMEKTKTEKFLRFKRNLPLYGTTELTQRDKLALDKPFRSSRGTLIGVVLKIRNKMRIKQYLNNRRQ